MRNWNNPFAKQGDLSVNLVTLHGLESVSHVHLNGINGMRSQRTFQEERYILNMFMHVYMFIDA